MAADFDKSLGYNLRETHEDFFYIIKQKTKTQTANKTRKQQQQNMKITTHKVDISHSSRSPHWAHRLLQAKQPWHHVPSYDITSIHQLMDYSPKRCHTHTSQLVRQLATIAHGLGLGTSTQFDYE